MKANQLMAYILSRCRRDDECLIWTGAMTSSRHGPGRPVFCLRSIGCRNPRIELWRIRKRKIVAGFVFSLPICGDRRCIEPSHQLYVSRSEALQRASREGRLSAGVRHSLIAARAARQRATNKLNMALVRAMRARYDEIGVKRRVAQEFGVGYKTAWAVLAHRTWRERSPFSV